MSPQSSSPRFPHPATACLALLTGLAGAPALAQDAILLDEIVVTGAQEPQEARRTGVSVSVLTRDDLDKTAETSMTSVLSRLPGVGILSRGPMGTVTGITVRGLSQNYVKVLVDGIDVADPSSTQSFYDFGHLTTLGVSSVELLRGSHSAVHGGQAVGGVLSITSTPLPEEIGSEGRFALEAGSYDTYAATLGYGVRGANGALGFTLSQISTSGFSAADENDGNSEADGYEATRLTLRGETELQSGVVLGFSAFAEDSDGEYDEGFPLADGSPDEKSDATSKGLRLYAQFETGRFEHEIAATWFEIDRGLTGSTGYGASYNDFTGKRRGLSWKAGTDLGQGRLVFGADTTDEDYSETSAYGASKGDSTTSGIFAEYLWSPGESFDLTASIRHDDHSDFGGFTTGRVAAAWQAAPDITVRAALGTGFRAPSLYELYGPYGDDSLEAEESTSADLGIEKRWGDAAALRATLFWIETDNLIDYADLPAPPWGGYTQIPGTTRRNGVELEGELALSGRLSFTGAYTYTDASNPALSSGSTWNSGFGRHQLALGVDAALTDAISGSLTLLHVADRPALADYTVANATVTYDFGTETQAYLRVENLFDEEYQLREGYGTSDRALYVGLRRSF
ncbi:TonB-dependent receptor plug domain-containing protein [Frigidibacter mobilis]|uniref:TonB-dependent receptor n=1 Tax=Frigidibacter mobilis TaxID=1335048 RepID=A0A159Z334_9RHOB|nr:TonB-dependent receptor [Frigidibacter mobilis]AMY69421.1 TonB-dependent receptor [Frigidibacter mobilis]